MRSVRSAIESMLPRYCTKTSPVPPAITLLGGLGAPQDAGAERFAVSVGPVVRMFASPPDSPAV